MFIEVVVVVMLKKTLKFLLFKIRDKLNNKVEFILPN